MADRTVAQTTDRDYRQEYEALSRALVGDTGLSAIMEARRLRVENMLLRETLRDIARRPDRVEWRAAAMMAHAEEALARVES